MTPATRRLIKDAWEGDNLKEGVGFVTNYTFSGSGAEVTSINACGQVLCIPNASAA